MTGAFAAQMDARGPETYTELAAAVENVATSGPGRITFLEGDAPRLAPPAAYAAFTWCRAVGRRPDEEDE